MGATNFGSQSIVVQFLDPADSSSANKLLDGVRVTGIYEGCQLTKLSDISVQIGIGDFEIISTNTQGDGTKRQVRVITQSTQNLAVAASTPFIAWRYTFEESSGHYADLLAIAQNDILSTDLVIGRCSYSGSTLTGFDYTLRSDANTYDKFLKVEPLITPGMRVQIRRGRLNYGTQNFDIILQESALIVAPTTNPRIDLIYVDTDGTIKVRTGTEAAIPDAPNYLNRITIAEIYLTVGQTSITASSITDTRNFVSSGAAIGSGLSGLANNLKMTVSGSVSSSASITADQLSLKASDNSTIVVSNVNVTLSIDNSGINGLDTGTKANNIKYFIHVVYNPTTTIVGAIFSLSASTPTLPSGFVYSELFSMARTNASGFLLGARHRKNNYYYKSWAQLDYVASSTGGWKAVDLSSYVPSELSEFAFGSSIINQVGFTVGVTNDNTVTIPVASTDVPGNQIGGAENETSSYTSQFWQMEVITTNTLYWRATKESYFYLHGFRITR